MYLFDVRNVDLKDIMQLSLSLNYELLRRYWLFIMIMILTAYCVYKWR